jgi:hypothetical protein
VNYFLASGRDTASDYGHWEVVVIACNKAEARKKVKDHLFEYGKIHLSDSMLLEPMNIKMETKILWSTVQT